MKIYFHNAFVKHYRKRIVVNRKLDLKAEERISQFKQNPQSPVLKDHQLSGAKRHMRSFWIAGDIRIIYRIISAGEIEFMDIGSHNQVY